MHLNTFGLKIKNKRKNLGRMKTKMFYGLKYESLDELKEAIHDYIYYYNNKRIKSKLKGLSPIEYRTQSYSFV